MMRILLIGSEGRMGRAVSAACTDGQTVAARVDSVPADGVYGDVSLVTEKCDVIIDFSSHGYTSKVLGYAVKNGVPAVIATTGHSAEELEMIKEASSKVAVFKSGNMSVAVNVLCRLAAEAASMLGNFDIEIIESHHRNKLDAPSGTALMIASEIQSVREGAELVYDRTGRSCRRPDNEIGIHSVRGGTDVGEHEVIFFGQGERLSIKHVAEGRELFAKGALCAAAYMIGKPAGFYDMKSLLSDGVTKGAAK